MNMVSSVSATNGDSDGVVGVFSSVIIIAQSGIRDTENIISWLEKVILEQLLLGKVLVYLGSSFLEQILFGKNWFV